MKLSVNKRSRTAKQRAHSWVHLLYWALEKVTERSDIKQAWSYVDEDYARLDFNSESNLSLKELHKIEDLANKRIWDSIEIDISEKTMEEAMKEWAKAFFDEKYWEKVRVINIPWVDIQLCGWTHSKNTADIWAFKIISQDAVSSGIKRISIITWPKVAKNAQEQEIYIWKISESLDCAPAQIIEKTTKLNKDLEQKNAELENLKLNSIKSELEKVEKLNWKFDYAISGEDFKWIDFKDLVKKTREILQGNILIYNKQGNFAIIWNQEFSAKNFAKAQSLKWGGNDAMVQWKDPKIFEIIENLK